MWRTCTAEQMQEVLATYRQLERELLRKSYQSIIARMVMRQRIYYSYAGVDDREDFAHMLYYISPLPDKMAKWNGNNKIDDHFDLSTDSNDLAGGPVVLLTRTKPTASMLARARGGVKELGEVIMRRDSKYSRSYFMFVFFDWSVVQLDNQ